MTWYEGEHAERQIGTCTMSSSISSCETPDQALNPSLNGVSSPGGTKLPAIAGLWQEFYEITHLDNVGPCLTHSSYSTNRNHH